MGGLDHGPNVTTHEDPAVAARNARFGLVLFAVYLVLYGGFMLLNTLAPHWLERTPLAGVNLAILYGFGLIAAALLLALIYGYLCRGAAAVPNDPHAPRRP